MVPLTSLRRDPSVEDRGRTTPELGAGSRQLLNHLRLVALDCRAAARADLFEACALLSQDRAIAKTAHAEALMRCLDQAIGRSPKMLRPGVGEVSFDEAWLVRLVGAAGRGDTQSFDFLMRSRVEPWARRSVGFLAQSLAEQFPQD